MLKTPVTSLNSTILLILQLDKNVDLTAHQWIKIHVDHCKLQKINPTLIQILISADLVTEQPQSTM